MQKHELPELSQRLSQLADALGGKSPSPAGLLVWGDALNECRFDDVQGALSDWPKKNTKMPAPADILKVCRERTSTKLEDESRKNNAAPGFDAQRLRGSTEVARHYLAEIKEILADCEPGLVCGTFHHIGGRPNMDHKEWARVLRVKHESGERLTLAQIEAYRGALGLQ